MAWAFPACHAKSTPAPAHFFTQQKVDHFDVDSPAVWSQRYYKWDKEFLGPGHPIFIIIGGEGGIPPSSGLYYPYITHHLSKNFGAYVLQPEHRFYGKSQPLKNSSVAVRPVCSSAEEDSDCLEEDPRVNLFTSEQALYDAMVLLEHVQKELNCHTVDRFSPNYCPIITVGGSYPGFLSAMARIMFPHKVDMAYAASAPMGFYSQHVHQYDYYNHITKVAEQTLEGCSTQVRNTLDDIVSLIRSLVEKKPAGVSSGGNESNYNYGAGKDAIKLLEHALGICPATIPEYCLDSSSNTTVDAQTFIDEVMMVVGYSFANDNMANYPPNNSSRLYKACATFSSSKLSSQEKIREFLIQRVGNKKACDEKQSDHDSVRRRKATECPCSACWNMAAQLPTGHDATITGGDWSGDGTGSDAESWDFQTCTLLVEAIGFGPQSMFPPRDWSLDWMIEHCQKRFGVTPYPTKLNSKWGFDNLVVNNVTHIVFTNGENDGWSVGGIKTNLSDTLLAFNFPNGAHHSELGSPVSPDFDTEDVTEGYHLIRSLLSTWLDEIYTKRAG